MELSNNKFFIELNLEDQLSLKKIFFSIFLILVYVIYWDFTTLQTVLTVEYIFVKSVSVGIFLVGSVLAYFNKVPNYFPLLSCVILFCYSFYGMLAIHFTYCYSFWEIYFGVSFFYRTSKKTYLATMFFGLLLNIFALKLSNEPEFVKIGYTLKPHYLIVSFVMFALSSLLYFTVTKKREEIFELQEKFANIGKQSSFIFHEIKKPMSRLIAENRFVSEDVQKIKNIMLSVDLLMKNPEDFKDSFEEFNFSEILSNLESGFHDFLINFNIEFKYPKSEIRIRANKELFMQVFKNLTINAIEAIVEAKLEKATIEIDVLYNSKNNTHSISFFNTGDNIKTSNLDKVFLPFFTTKNSEYNNGLGLSFCKSVIDAHNGLISLNSTKHGPEFVIIWKS